jgi:hypothetical protein
LSSVKALLQPEFQSLQVEDNVPGAKGGSLKPKNSLGKWPVCCIFDENQHNNS